MFDNLFRLDNKLAVVTGAGNGLGRSFALGLAAFGAKVICADRNLEGAEETASLAKQSRLQAEAVHNDVADEASVDALWETIKQRYGRVDILINNAGIATASGRTHEFSIADWDGLMAINLRGAFLTTRQALQLMLPGPGSIINIASVAGLRGYSRALSRCRSTIRRRKRGSSASRARSRPNTRRKRSASTQSRRAGMAAPRSPPNAAPSQPRSRWRSSRRRSTSASR